jgi:peptidoglycan hydrolase-like protein with peptidoglycan-binding domain
MRSEAMVAINPRSNWTSQAWAGQPYTVPAFVRTEYMIHYEGGTPTHDTGAAAMLAIDRIHRDNGWSGIGYNFVIFQDGSVWEGRGWDLVGAHCPDHNRIGLGVQIHVGGDQVPSPQALAAGRALWVEAQQRCGTLRVLGHRDGYATECPGGLLEDWLHNGLLAGPTHVPPQTRVVPAIEPAPTFPLPAGSYFGPEPGPVTSVSGYHGHRDDLKVWQRRMSTRGWQIAIDGLYGPQTAGVARHFQREKRLRIDGLIGPSTWSQAWQAPIT